MSHISAVIKKYPLTTFLSSDVRVVLVGVDSLRGGQLRQSHRQFRPLLVVLALTQAGQA